MEDPISVLPDLEGVKVGSWVENIDHRLFPMINIRRLGGERNRNAPTLLADPVIELTVFHDEDVESAERLYEDALDVLYEAVRKQTQTPRGWLHSINENMGSTNFSSLFMDSWRVQGLVQLGIRPPRTTP